MLKINNVDKYFNRFKRNKIHVINHTTIETESTGLVALLGPSGCGKTTLLNVIGGLDKVGKGKIYINGQKISSRFMHKVDKIRNNNIGYIFQDYKLIENLSVYDNVAFVLKMLGIKDKKEIKEKVEYVLDCVGMLRYKRRPASMLSGGERQRVGIARALVKDPNIILADEPTGNLDSKNSLEIMRIIKAISEKKLVILVTHEQELARFYATRIIEIEDGTIIKDYPNNDIKDLDYELDNCFYLKDFKDKINLKDKKIDINIYRNDNEKLQLDIVIKNGNIYIKSNEDLKPEVVDNESSIEFINGSYEKLSSKKSTKYNFDFDKIKSNRKKRYASIINPFTLILGGFQKVLDYSFLKKILLAGFFLAGMFILYSVSTYKASKQIIEKDFITINKNYLTVETNKIKLDSYLNDEKDENILYIIPGTSKVNMLVPLNNYYQTNTTTLGMTVSISSIELLTDKDIIYGKLPTNNKEVVIDDLAFEKAKEQDFSYQMANLITSKDMLNKIIKIDEREYTVVGITNKISPCLYVDRNEIIKILSVSNIDTSSVKDDNTTATIRNTQSYIDNKDKLEITKGRTPDKDYEVIVNDLNKELMPLNKEIDTKINGKKLTVVGYYKSKYDLQGMYTNDNTIKYLVIISKKSFTIMPKDKDKVIEKYRNNNSNIIDTYSKEKEKYIKQKNKENKSTIIVSLIILTISFIEIYLMIRSSFLSRIKEVGIYRAIGLKRIDICKMFTGEIIAITTLASLPGLLSMAYILHVLSGIKQLQSYILINSEVLLISIILVYTFNIIVGLLPVMNTIRKRPATILSRTDLD